jgi:RNA polymerase sigma-70 factor (sigma-E family)
VASNRAPGDFTDFVRASSGSLLHTAWLLSGDRHRAEDLVQTALVRTYAAWARVRREDALAYTRRVLVNLDKDWWRRRPWREQSAAAVPDRVAAVDPLAQVDQRSALVRALAALGRRERAVVVLRYYADLPEAEVAELLGISVGGVKSAASRALVKLRVSAELSDLPQHAEYDTTPLGGIR